MPVAYPPSLPLAMLGHTREQPAAFGVSQPRRGYGYIEPTGTDTPVFWSLTWRLTTSQARTFTQWTTYVLQRCTLPFTMGVRTEFGVVEHELQFLPDGLLPAKQIGGDLWEYQATVMARGIVGVPPDNEDGAFSEYFESVTDADFSFFADGSPSSGLPPSVSLVTGYRGEGLYLGPIGGSGDTEELVIRALTTSHVVGSIKAKFYIHSLSETDDAAEFDLLRADDSGLVGINPRRQASSDASRRMHINVAGSVNAIGAALSVSTWYEIQVDFALGANNCTYTLRDAATAATVYSGTLTGTIANDAARTVNRFAFYHQGASGTTSVPVTWDEIEGTDA